MPSVNNFLGVSDKMSGMQVKVCGDSTDEK